MIFGAIAGTLVSGLMARRNAKKQREAALEDARLSLPRMVASAKDAGFNPLTALRNGAQGAFTGLPSGHAPLASTQAIMNITQGIEDKLTGKEAREKEIEDAEHELMQINLERARAGGGYPAVNRTFNKSVPMSVSRAPLIKRGEASAPQKLPETGKTMNTNPIPISSDGDSYVDPRRPDAEHGEQRWGDLAQEIMGFANAVSDRAYNKFMEPIERSYGQAGARQVHEAIKANPTVPIEETARRVTRQLPMLRAPKIPARPIRDRRNSEIHKPYNGLQPFTLP